MVVGRSEGETSRIERRLDERKKKEGTRRAEILLVLR